VLQALRFQMRMSRGPRYNLLAPNDEIEPSTPSVLCLFPCFGPVRTTTTETSERAQSQDLNAGLRSTTSLISTSVFKVPPISKPHSSPSLDHPQASTTSRLQVRNIQDWPRTQASDRNSRSTSKHTLTILFCARLQ
jgi:hypothetical protein